MARNNNERGATATKARRMIRLIKSRHRLGREAIAQRRSTSELAAALGRSHGLASKIKKFARAYDERQLEAVCELRRQNGLPLSFAHILPLLSVPDRQARREMELEAVAENLSGQDVQRRIRDRTPRSSNPGGRRLRQPRDVRSGLERVCVETKLACRRVEQLHSILSNLTDTARTQSVPTELAESTKTACEQLASECGHFAVVLRQILSGNRRPPQPEAATEV